MTVIEYGKGYPNTVMLLHGGGLSWRNYRDSAKLLHGRIPGSTMEFLSGLRHGELSICYPERYATMLQEMISRQPSNRKSGCIR